MVIFVCDSNSHFQSPVSITWEDFNIKNSMLLSVMACSLVRVTTFQRNLLPPPVRQVILHRWWRQQIPLKHQYTATILQSITFQKTESSLSLPWKPKTLRNFIYLCDLRCSCCCWWRSVFWGMRPCWLVGLHIEGSWRLEGSKILQNTGNKLPYNTMPYPRGLLSSFHFTAYVILF
jgi:hypothetical protein